MSDTLNNRKSYRQIVAHIRRSISLGKLRAGDRLPPETELAKQLGVSRPTVREGLKVLESQNILRSSTGPTGGTFIKQIDDLSIAEYLKDSISLLLDVDELTLEELWNARETIDIPATGLAATLRTEQDLFVIQKTIETDELKHGNNIVSDISFHRAIAEASKNRMLSLFMSSIYMTLRALSERYILPDEMLMKVKNTSQKQHRLIYDAIVAGDEALARNRMQDHLRLSYGVYRRAIPKKLVGRPQEELLEEDSLSGTI